MFKFKLCYTVIFIFLILFKRKEHEILLLSALLHAFKLDLRLRNKPNLRVRLLCLLSDLDVIHH